MLRGYVKEDMVCLSRETFDVLVRCIINQRFTDMSSDEQRKRQAQIDGVVGWANTLVKGDAEAVLLPTAPDATYLFHFCHPETEEMIHTSIGKTASEAKERLERALEIRDDNVYKIKAFILDENKEKAYCRCGQ